MWQPVLMINGYLISVLGLAMLIPAAVDMLETGRNWSLFVTSSIVSLFIGLSLFLGNRTKIEKITLQQGYLLTAVSWVSLTLLATLPFILSDVTPGFADALFEAMSGLSTTGATVITDLEVLPDSILLWRSMLNGLGGVGIVIFAVALLPFLGIGGMQIFQRENSDLNDKFMPKFNYIAKRIMAVYFILVALCAGCLYFAGMTPLESVNYAMAAIATGGFSTKNASVGFYDSVSIEMILVKTASLSGGHACKFFSQTNNGSVAVKFNPGRNRFLPGAQLNVKVGSGGLHLSQPVNVFKADFGLIQVFFRADYDTVVLGVNL